MPYDDALRTARADLIRAIMERDKLNLEIARLQQLVKALTFAAVKDQEKGRVPQTFEAALGFTETVVTIVRTSKEAVSARDIRDRLNDLGYDLSKYANPLGFVHSVLGRLVQQEKIRETQPGFYVFNDAFYIALLRTALHANHESPGGAVPGDLTTSATSKDALNAALLAFGLGPMPEHLGVVPGESSASGTNKGVALPEGLTPPPKLADFDKSGKR
jgi:hypothetical protein